MGRGEKENLLCDAGSELRLGGREKKGEEIDGMDKNKQNKQIVGTSGNRHAISPTN